MALLCLEHSDTSYHHCHDLPRWRASIFCKLLILLWWRRGELNPRPKKPVVKRTTCVSGSWFSTFTSEPARAVKA